MSWRAFAFLISVVLLSAGPAPPAFLLPDEVKPTRHIIELTIDPSLDTFKGIARIEIELSKPTNVVWVNSKNLTPHDASVEWNGRRQAVRAETAGEEFIRVELDSPIGPGRAMITIPYQGKLDETAIVGPYRNKVNGEWYAFTTFTPIDARRAFPCFDEPRFKTPWEISIHIKRDQKAFSNGRETSETDEPNGMKLVRFAPTVPLAAEVIAFCVGPFDVYEGTPAGHGVPIRIISPKGQRDQSKIAAQATVDVLPRLEAYTGIPFPYEKLDHVAVPEFKFGAVENVGMITYRSTSLLLGPTDNAIEKSRRVRGLEAHEMGHQWFGDMVTQASWDDVWLSEGFATWISAKIMDQEQPPSRQLLSSIVSREAIMAMDASARTRPVRLHMTSRDDMDNRQKTDTVYSRMVYNKGAALLVMLDGWLGEEKVRDGLRAYLKDHQFGNATTADLESELRKSTGVDPSPVMDSHLNATGIPVVSAELQCDKSTVVIHRTQGTIPVCVSGEGIEKTCAVIDESHSSISLKKGSSCPAWIYLNAGGSGYYRTQFTAAQLDALEKATLTAAERLTLVYDLRAAKQTNAAILKTLAHDPEPEIAKAASDLLAGK